MLRERTIGVAMLGYAFMGKAHSRALQALRRLDVPLRPELVSISGRNEEAVEEAREEWGWADAVTDWREQVADERVQLFDNGGPNAVHAEPCIEAARNGKHVLCEKPLGLSAEESHRMWQEAERAGVVHMCGFNYRFVPAVRLVRELLDAGELGDVVHFRARYLQSWGWDADESAWRFDREAGTGALGDLGTHIVDLARYLVGEISTVSASVRTLVPGRKVDDHFVPPSSSRTASPGRSRPRASPGPHQLERVRGQRDEGLGVFRRRAAERARGRGRKGFRRVLVTEEEHPYMRFWWPPGHIIGWGDTFVHELAHMLEAIAGEHEVGPHGATFEDGYRCDEVVEAILRSAESGRREEVRVAVKTSLDLGARPMVTRFVPGGYQPEWAGESTVERVRRAVDGLGDLIDGYEFHYPGELDEQSLEEIREALGGHDIYALASGLHLDPRFGRGGLISPDADTRAEARRRTVAAAELAGSIGAHFIVWPGIEGYNYPFQTSYAESWKWLIEGIGEAAQRCADHGVFLFLEHKNSEPAMKILMRNIGMTLHVIHVLAARVSRTSRSTWTGSTS